jgi:hypothetical protein
MIRKLGWLLTLAGLACVVWIIYNWWVSRPINPYFFLGILVLLLGNTLLRRPDEPRSSDPDGLVSPSVRRARNEHKSWIQK